MNLCTYAATAGMSSTSWLHHLRRCGGNEGAGAGASFFFMTAPTTTEAAAPFAFRRVRTGHIPDRTDRSEFLAPRNIYFSVSIGNRAELEPQPARGPRAPKQSE